MAFGAGNYYRSPVSAFSAETPGSVRLRFRLSQMPTGGFKWIAGFTGSSNEGWLICFDQLSYAGAVTQAQIAVYCALDGALKVIGFKAPLVEEVGNLIAVHLVLDGTKARAYIDGIEIAKEPVPVGGLGIAYSAFVPGLTLTIGASESGGLSCEQEVVELAISSQQMTPAQVLADAQKAIGTAMTAEIHHWTVVAGLGATWNATAGSVNLTRTGTPTITGRSSLLRQNACAWNLIGDSITAGRNAGGGLGSGWRDAFQRATLVANKGSIILGSKQQEVIPVTFEPWDDGTPSETIQAKLLTLATDLPVIGNATTGVILSYGVNDTIGGRSLVQVQADVASAVTLHLAARPTAPIILACPLPVSSSASGSTPTTRAVHASLIAGWPAMASAIQSAHPTANIRASYPNTAVTNPDDVLQLFDGYHPTPTVYAAMGAIHAAVAVAMT